MHGEDENTVFVHFGAGEAERFVGPNMVKAAEVCGVEHLGRGTFVLLRAQAVRVFAVERCTLYPDRASPFVVHHHDRVRLAERLERAVQKETAACVDCYIDAFPLFRAKSGSEFWENGSEFCENGSEFL